MLSIIFVLISYTVNGPTSQIPTPTYLAGTEEPSGFRDGLSSGFSTMLFFGGIGFVAALIFGYIFVYPLATSGERRDNFDENLDDILDD